MGTTMKKSTAALLKSAAKPLDTKKKASDIPELTGHEKFADKLHNAVLKIKEAGNEVKEAEGELLPLAEAEHARLAASGAFTKTINIPGKATAGVQITWQDVFSAIPSENEEELKKVDPKFDEHFEEVRSLILKQTSHADITFLLKKLGKEITDIFSISLKDTSGATIDMLADKLGADDFLRLFEIKTGLKTKKGLDEKMHELPAAVKPFLKQAKGAVKLRASK